MNFENWLKLIGKSDRTAKSYAGAISSRISEWANSAGLIDAKLTDIESSRQFIGIADAIKRLDAFQESDAKGKGMYGAALNQYAAYLADVSNEELQDDIEEVLSNSSIDKTEQSTLINARVGQGKFRKQLIDQWQGCALTGFADTRFLIASHIQPWRESKPKQRLDSFNGLLLLPNLDKVFDLGFITFSEQGRIKISEALENRNMLGLSVEMRIQLKDRHQEYMAFHRECVFEKHC